MNKSQHIVFYVILSTITMLLSGCTNNTFQYSVTQPISEEEIQYIEKNSPRFSELYSQIQQLRSQISAEDMCKYSSLTYSDLYDFTVYVNKNAKLIRLQGTQTWSDMCENYALKLDSIHQYWSNWYEKNKLDALIDIKCLDILTNEDNPYCKCRVMIKNKSRQTIDHITYAFSVADKGQEPLCYSAGSFNDYLGYDKQALDIAFTEVTQQDIFISPSRVDDMLQLINCSNSKLYDNYNFAYQIFSITKDGKTTTAKDIYNQIPNAEIVTKPLWRTCKGETGQWHYLKRGVQALYDIILPEKEDFINNYYHDFLTEVNALAFDFHNRLSE